MKDEICWWNILREKWINPRLIMNAVANNVQIIFGWLSFDLNICKFFVLVDTRSDISNPIVYRNKLYTMFKIIFGGL